jgi:hypothetical protein
MERLSAKLVWKPLVVIVEEGDPRSCTLADANIPRSGGTAILGQFSDD